MATWNAIATSPLVENERQPLIDSKGVQPTSSSTNISINASNPESAAVERGLSACDEVVVELPDPAARGKTELHLRSFFLTLGPAVTLAVFFAGTGGWIHKVTLSSAPLMMTCLSLVSIAMSGIFTRCSFHCMGFTFWNAAAQRRADTPAT